MWMWVWVVVGRPSDKQATCPGCTLPSCKDSWYRLQHPHKPACRISSDRKWMVGWVLPHYNYQLVCNCVCLLFTDCYSNEIINTINDLCRKVMICKHRKPQKNKINLNCVMNYAQLPVWPLRILLYLYSFTLVLLYFSASSTVAVCLCLSHEVFYRHWPSQHVCVFSLCVF